MDLLNIDSDRLTTLEQQGYLHLSNILPARAAEELIDLYPNRDLFHRKVDMTRAGYGRGDYKYFNDQGLPPLIAALRKNLYAATQTLGVSWAPELGLTHELPEKWHDFDTICRDHGQTLPACLLLRYPADGYNDLHQDLYGPDKIIFPFQMVLMLSDRADYDGGAFVLQEKNASGQIKATELELQKGDAVIFATRHRIADNGENIDIQHGVRPMTRGSRWTAGVIAHNWGPKF